MGFENGKLVRVVLRATVADDQMVTTLHYDLDDNNDLQPNDPQSLADTFRDDVVPTFKALFNSAWSIQPVIVQEEFDPLNPTRPRSGWVSGAAVAGTRVDAAEQLPRAACQVTSLLTGLIGRRFRGRIFVPGSYYEDDQAGGVFNAALLTKVAAFTNSIPRQPDIAGPGSDSVANWCVYSRTQRAANLDPYAAHVATTVARAGVYWLRSRQNSF